MLFLLVTLQTLNVPAGFDLARVKKAEANRCGEAAGSDILVCAPKEQPRLEAIDENAYPDSNRADFALDGDWRGHVHIDQQALGGAISNRVMVTATLRF